MISSLADYKMTTPPTGILIDGGIMPARDVSNDGSWKILRGEDPCFLAEAIARMTAMKGYGSHGSPTIVPVTNEVKGAVWNNLSTSCIVRGLLGVSGYTVGGTTYQYVFTRQPTTAGTYTMNVGNVSGLDQILNSLQSGSYQTPSFVSNINEAWSGKPLIADNVRKVWYDYRKYGAIVSLGGGMKVSGASGTETRRSYNQGVQVHEQVQSLSVPSEYISYSILSGSNRFAEGGVGGAWANEYSWTLDAVLPYASGYYHTSPLSVLSGMDAIVLLTIQTQTADPATGQLYSPVYDTLACAGTVDSDGLVSMSGVTSSGILADIQNARTFPEKADLLSDTPPYGTAYFGCDSSVHVCGVIFYDPDIDTAEINWPWTPS